MRRYASRGLLVVGILLLSYCGFIVWDAHRFQQNAERTLSALRRTHLSPSQPEPQLPAPADPLIGRIDIPRLGVSVVVMEGTTEATLRRAAGHIPGTALPGQPGNVAISAHRDTYFRPLRNIHRDDLITFTTPAGEYRYQVLSTRIVAPSDVSVIASASDPILTLITCYPFYFIGPAPRRFIVRATLRTMGLPARR